ncbi:hypothetical protein J7643_03620 [bacterium]|nr:hypothetical protein [bacterium]
MREAEIQAAVLRVLGARPDLRLWRANSGAAIDSRTGRMVRFGIPGQADLSGILASGRRLEIEIKGPRGSQTPEQLHFGAMITRFGGLYVVAHSLEEAVFAVEEAL